jgi:hypothetical protein
MKWLGGCLKTARQANEGFDAERGKVTMTFITSSMTELIDQRGLRKMLVSEWFSDVREARLTKAEYRNRGEPLPGVCEPLRPHFRSRNLSVQAEKLS